VTRGYAEARKLRTLSPHRGAVQPRCQHFGPCGGCTLQSLAYERQLAEKQNQVWEERAGVAGLVTPFFLDLLWAATWSLEIPCRWSVACLALSWQGQLYSLIALLFCHPQVVQVLKRVGRLGDSVERVMLPPLGASAAQR
jgi:hypothetical protein